MGWQGARTLQQKNKGAMRAAVLTRRAMVQKQQKNEKQHTTEKKAEAKWGEGKETHAQMQLSHQQAWI